MNELYLFLVWLVTYAEHVAWYVNLRTSPASLHTVYGGNFVDAVHYRPLV